MPNKTFTYVDIFYMKPQNKFTQSQIDRIVEMAWEDRTPFEAIEYQFGLKEAEVRKIMRSEMKQSSFTMWRERVSGRKTKHNASSKSKRFKSPNHRG